MTLFQDTEEVRKFSENLASLVRRAYKGDYSGVSNPNPERSIDELSEGHKIVQLGKHLFYEDNTLSFMFIPEAAGGSIVDIRNGLFLSSEPNPMIKGEFKLRRDSSTYKDRCSGFEIIFSYKMPNGEPQIQKDKLPDNYGRDNALDVGHFVEVSGRLPTGIKVHFPGYSSSVSFSDFKRKVTDAHQVREYIVGQVVQGIEMNKKHELLRINDYYGSVESREKETAIRELDEGTDALKTAVTDPSAEFYCMGVEYDQSDFSFRRETMNEFRREGFGGQWIANILQVKIRKATDEALEVLPQLLQSYLTSDTKL